MLSQVHPRSAADNAAVHHVHGRSGIAASMIVIMSIISNLIYELTLYVNPELPTWIEGCAEIFICLYLLVQLVSDYIE
jgi:hypothetical protein